MLRQFSEMNIPRIFKCVLFSWTICHHLSLQDTTRQPCEVPVQARRSFILEVHKPCSILTFIPKFEIASSSYSYLFRQDLDGERTQAFKLHHHCKQEQNGTRFFQFIAGLDQNKQMEKDGAYKSTHLDTVATLLV